jgi:hypothetical protein
MKQIKLVITGNPEDVDICVNYTKRICEVWKVDLQIGNPVTKRDEKWQPPK